MLRGLATVSFWADDLAARDWYVELLGIMTNPHYLEVLGGRGKE